MTGKLVLSEDGGGPRHYLDGRPVHCGEPLQVRLGGVWLWVRYEASLKSLDRVSVCLHADGGKIIPDDRATFRWKEDAR